jgi:hypothetical protein
VSRTPLSSYLRDHLAGATAGVNLARRVAAHAVGTPSGARLATIAAEIAADREALVRLMSQLGIRPSYLENALTRAGELADRLHALHGEPVTRRLHELEMLSLGIAGKLALWEALRAVPELTTQADLDRLIERARDQRARVEAERMACARAALAPGGTVHRLHADRTA